MAWNRLVAAVCWFASCAMPELAVAPLSAPVAIPAEPQRGGDPAQGYRALVNGDYIGLGMPWAGYVQAVPSVHERDTLPGREGKNALVRYSLNVSVNRRGVEVVSPNCLSCHAYHLDGQLVVGLGRPARFEIGPLGAAEPNLLRVQMGLTRPEETAEFQRFLGRLQTGVEAGPFNTFASYAAHRDPHTLEWSNQPRFDGQTGLVGWVDIPPWWRVKKKHGLYANGMGRGDQVGHLMNMSVFSLEDEDEAHHVERLFVDIAAYLRSLEAPKFPAPVDAGLAAEGEVHFGQHCARCHGTYGPDGQYPNLLIPVAEVGTDPALAEKSWVNRSAAQWFNASFFGRRARVELQAGYVAPPLDGIWATAPFLHNGSVPNLEALLDSSKRPARWQSAFLEYDYQSVGWRLGSGAGYDTTLEGLSNQGHPFGDALSPDQRRAVLEYLKTL